LNRSPSWQIDGQRRPREPERRLEILDGFGLDLKMTALPLVIEHSSFGPFYAAGGEWIETQVSDL